MRLIWAKSLYGAHVGLEWDKCPDSAHMGPTYTCLLGHMLSAERRRHDNHVLFGDVTYDVRNSH